MNRLETGIANTLKEHLDSQFPQASFDTIWNAASEKKSIRSRKPLFVTIFAVILVTTTAFSIHQFIWGNTNVYINKNGEDLTNYITPLETFENLTRVQGAKTFNLLESRKKVHFPIRQPGEIASWTKIKSVGVVLPSSYSKGSKTIIGESPLYYLDLYVNNSNQQRIVVTQEYDASMSAALKKKKGEGYSVVYPNGSKILTEFGSDFAVLMNLQKERYDLQIKHKEENNSTTTIDVWGNTTPEILKDFVRKYLSAPFQ
jgi:hypothetical protein